MTLGLLFLIVVRFFFKLELTLKRNLSLFSIILHFIRCMRSCDNLQKYPSHCILCSRIEGQNWHPCESSFKPIQIEKNDWTLLGFDRGSIIDLDKVVSKADDYFKYFKLKEPKCSFYQEFRYIDDIFAAFSSRLIRMYLSLTASILNKFFKCKSFEYKILDLIGKEGVFLLGFFWHETNIEFLYEFFDKFSDINKSYCYNTKKSKPKFGPYNPSAFDNKFEVIFL